MISFESIRQLDSYLFDVKIVPWDRHVLLIHKAIFRDIIKIYTKLICFYMCKLFGFGGGLWVLFF